MSGEEEIIIIRRAANKQIASFPVSQAPAGLRELADKLETGSVGDDEGPEQVG